MHVRKERKEKKKGELNGKKKAIANLSKSVLVPADAHHSQAAGTAQGHVESIVPDGIQRLGLLLRLEAVVTPLDDEELWMLIG